MHVLACSVGKRLGLALLSIVVMVGMGCGQSTSASEASVETPLPLTVAVTFERLVAPTAVARVVDATPELRLRRFSFSGGGIGGSYAFWDPGLQSAAEKVRAFADSMRTRTRRTTRVRFRRLLQECGGFTLDRFASSLDCQQDGASLLAYHRERDTLLTRLATDAPMIHRATVTGSLSALQRLIDLEAVAGVLPQRHRLDWMFVLQTPMDIAVGRPESMRQYDERRARRIRQLLDSLRAVPDTGAVPERLVRLHSRLRTVAEQEYGVHLQRIEPAPRPSTEDPRDGSAPTGSPQADS
jgi:hypothetical protein